MSDTKCEVCGMEMKYHGATCTAGGSFAAPMGSAFLDTHVTELHNLGNDPEEWAEIRVRKDLIPKGATLVESYLTEREVIVMGCPAEDDEGHNCDAMGCGTLIHVLYRLTLPNSMFGPKFPDQWAVSMDPMVSWGHSLATGGLCQQVIAAGTSLAASTPGWLGIEVTTTSNIQHRILSLEPRTLKGRTKPS
jgi:hypothetical protein